MAKKKSKNSIPGPQATYPWNRWFKLGTKHTLRKGRDFKCTTKTMTVYLYASAKRHRTKVHVKELSEGVLQIQAHNGKK